MLGTPILVSAPIIQQKYGRHTPAFIMNGRNKSYPPPFFAVVGKSVLSPPPLYCSWVKRFVEMWKGVLIGCDYVEVE